MVLIWPFVPLFSPLARQNGQDFLGLPDGTPMFKIHMPIVQVINTIMLPSVLCTGHCVCFIAHSEILARLAQFLTGTSLAQWPERTCMLLFKPEYPTLLWQQVKILTALGSSQGDLLCIMKV
jgi:hypothetical protein